MEKIITKKFSSKIVINAQEIDKILADEKKKLGKYEYDLTEVFLKIKKPRLGRLQKRINKFFVSAKSRNII